MPRIAEETSSPQTEKVATASPSTTRISTSTATSSAPGGRSEPDLPSRQVVLRIRVPHCSPRPRARLSIPWEQRNRPAVPVDCTTIARIPPSWRRGTEPASSRRTQILLSGSTSSRRQTHRRLLSRQVQPHPRRRVVRRSLRERYSAVRRRTASSSALTVAPTTKRSSRTFGGQTKMKTKTKMKTRTSSDSRALYYTAVDWHPNNVLSPVGARATMPCRLALRRSVLPARVHRCAPDTRSITEDLIPILPAPCFDRGMYLCLCPLFSSCGHPARLHILALRVLACSAQLLPGRLTHQMYVLVTGAWENQTFEDAPGPYIARLRLLALSRRPPGRAASDGVAIPMLLMVPVSPWWFELPEMGLCVQCTAPSKGR